MKNFILSILVMLWFFNCNFAYAIFDEVCYFEPRYNGEEYRYFVKYSTNSNGEIYPNEISFWLNGKLYGGGGGGAVYYDDVKEIYTVSTSFTVPLSLHKLGQNSFWFDYLSFFICYGDGPYIYDYITPTPTLTITPTMTETATLSPTQTATPTSTPLPMTEKWVPYWEVNHGNKRDTFFSVSSSSDIYVEGAFEFYDNNVDMVGSVPLTLAPHGMQTLTADHAIFSHESETESSPAGGYYGYAKVMVMGGDFEVFGAVFRSNVGIEYTLSTVEPMTSPVRIPLFQVAEGLSDTLLYLTNPNNEKIDVSGKLYENNGEKIADFTVPLSPHKMKERALSIHIDPSIKSLYGSCVLEWEEDAGIMVFPLVRYNNTDRYFRVEVK